MSCQHAKKAHTTSQNYKHKVNMSMYHSDKCCSKLRVGSHVVSVRIHCTEKWRTSFHTDVFSKSK